MKGFKWISALMVLLVAVLALASVQAQVVQIDSVKVDNDELSATGVLNVERGETLDIKVVFTALQDDEEVELEAFLTGYDGPRISDVEYVDEVNNGSTYVEKLSLTLPSDMDQIEQYSLRIRVSPRSGAPVDAQFELQIEAVEHAFTIKDVVFSPGQTVEAGKALLTTVRVENLGDEDDQDGIKVQVSIPELGLQAVDYLDEVDEDDSTSSEELYLRIPTNVATGDYQAVVKVWYNDMDDSVSETYSLHVVNNELQAAAPVQPVEPSKTIITVGPEVQQVTAGQGGAVYPVTLTNVAGPAKTYVISVEGYQAWGTARVDPSNVLVVQSGETKAAYVFVSANEAVSGQQTFAVKVSSNGESLKELVLSANVASAAPVVNEEEASWDSVKQGLEVGLFVLVVLVFILGIIIAVNKLRGSEKSESEDSNSSSQTYY